MLGINIKKLQDFLFDTDKGLPSYFKSFKRSPDLMKIFKILIQEPKIIHNGIEYKMGIDEKINFIFGTGHRHILTYKASQKFHISIGELVDTDDSCVIPPWISMEELRTVQEGDLVLVRFDKKDSSEGMLLEIQVLTCGLFQSTEDDFRQFRVDREDFFNYYRKYLELKDLGDDTSVKEEKDVYL